MAADVVSAKKDGQELGLEGPLKADHLCNLTVQHVFKFFSPFLKKTISIIEKPNEVIIVFDWEKHVNIDFFPHVRIGCKSQQRALYILQHSHNLGLVLGKLSVPGRLKFYCINTCLYVTLHCDRVA